MLDLGKQPRNLTDRPKRLAPGVSALRYRPPLLGYLGFKLNP